MININQNLKNRCGIYIIFNTKNGKKYIGSSNNLYVRLKNHIWHLRKGNHINTHLQNAFNKYTEDCFQIGILEYCSESDQLTTEQKYLDFFYPEYNIQTSAFVNKLEDQTKIKISNTIKTLYVKGQLDNRTYKQPLFVYDLTNFKLIQEYTCISDLNNNNNLSLNVKNTQINNGIINDKYCVTDKKFDTQLDAANFICENCLYHKPSRKSKHRKYLILRKLHKLFYFKSISKLAEFVNVNKSKIQKFIYKSNLKEFSNLFDTGYEIIISSQFIKLTELPF